MQSLQHPPGFKNRKTFRLVLLTLSSIAILAVGTLLYGRTSVQIPLNVGSSSGPIGPSTVPLAEPSLLPPVIVVLGALGLITGLGFVSIRRPTSIPNKPSIQPTFESKIEPLESMASEPDAKAESAEPSSPEPVFLTLPTHEVKTEPLEPLPPVLAV